MTNTRGLVKKLLAITKIQQLDAREYLYYSDLDKASRLAIEQPLKNYLLTKIPSLQEDAVGNLYLINSGTPLVCAHLDNVGSSAAQQELANVKVTNGILKGTKNIGADDKVGVAIALQLYANYGDKISLLFTVGEETGGIGSASFSTNYRALLESCSYCIIADRRGASDIIGVGNNYCTVEFRDAVKPILSKYGYKTAT